MVLHQKQKQLSLTEIFSSVQGETSFVGLPTTFVRLAACNLRCSWCDTPYSFGRGTAWEIPKLIEKVEQLGCQYVCITGGEPLLQETVYAFMSALCDRQFILSLETGGSLSTAQVDPRVSIILDIKCPGSAMEHKNHWANLSYLRPQDEVKFVLKDEQDYHYAKELCTKYHLASKVRNILFSPVHNQLDPQELVKWILVDRLPVRLNLQMHKYIWDPLTKGV